MSLVLPDEQDAHALLIKRLVTKPTDPNGLILEAWAQGFMVGALIIMACTTLANMRRGVLLHKLILVELILGIWHGFFIFFQPPVYNWWLSTSAIFLNASWSLHNVISWIKTKPFLSRRVSLRYLGTVILVQPYWVLEIYANFTYFNNVNTIFLHTRPYEALCRDPWWTFSALCLFYNIKKRYELSISQITSISPRFAVMLLAMAISIAFIILDICSVTDALKSSLPVGINPFWKLAFVFKCLTDSVVLGDFKTALDRLRAFQLSRLGNSSLDPGDAPSSSQDPKVPNSWQEVAAPTGHKAMPSPDGDYISAGARWNGLQAHRPSNLQPSASGYQRNPSRDRDGDGFFDVLTIDQQLNREASDAYMLSPQQSWRERSTASSEHVNAVRETVEVSDARNHSNDEEKQIGAAL